MSLSAEQQVLMTAIVERVAEIQAAIKRALPGNTLLHQEFHVGEPAPQTPSEAVALARAIEPAAKENRQLLVGRGVDGAKVTHLMAMAQNLEKLEASKPPAAPAPEPKKTRRKKA